MVTLPPSGAPDYLDPDYARSTEVTEQKPESATARTIRNLKLEGRREALTDLKERTERAIENLGELFWKRITEGNEAEAERLKEKGSGARLILGYIEEDLRALGGGN